MHGQIKNQINTAICFVLVKSSEWARHMTKLVTDIPQDVCYSNRSRTRLSKSTRRFCSVPHYKKFHKLQTFAQRSLKPFHSPQLSVLLFHTGKFLAFKQGLILGRPKYVSFTTLRIAPFIRPGFSRNKPQ